MYEGINVQSGGQQVNLNSLPKTENGELILEGVKSLKINVEDGASYNESNLEILENNDDVQVSFTDSQGNEIFIVLKGLAAMLLANQTDTPVFEVFEGPELVATMTTIDDLEAAAAGGAPAGSAQDGNPVGADDLNGTDSDALSARLPGLPGLDPADPNDPTLGNSIPVVEDVTLEDVNEVLGEEGAGDKNIITGQLEVSDADPGDIGLHTFAYVTGSLTVVNDSGVIDIVDDEIEVIVNPDGSFTLSGDFNDLAIDESATVSFDYTSTDIKGATSEPATVTITINGTNDIPVVEDITISEGEVITETVPVDYDEQTLSENHGRYTATTGLSDGGYIVTWSEYNEENTEIYYQRFDVDDNKVGGVVTVNSENTFSNYRPDVIELSNGDYIITWYARSTESKDTEIFAQRYDSEGNPLGSIMQINAPDNFSDYTPVITALNDGGYMVSWQGYADSSYYNTNIYAQRFDSDNNPVGGEIVVNLEDLTYEHNDYPSITTLLDGSFVVTWTTEDEVVAQRFDSTGNKVGSEFIVSIDDGYSDYNSTISALSDGGYVITWSGYDPSTGYREIYAQKFDSSDNKVGDIIQVTEGSDYEYEPAVATLVDGSFVITWFAYNNEVNAQEIYAQRFDADGNAIGEIETIRTGQNGYFGLPDIAALDDGGYVISYDGYEYTNDGERQVSSEYGVYSQRFGFETEVVSAENLETFDPTDVVDIDDTQDDGNNIYTGVLSVTDDDDNDTHIFSVVEDSLVIDGPTNSEGSPILEAEDFVINVIENADGSWSYYLEGDFSALREGETATVSFQYVANDQRGQDGTDGINESSISEPATITLTITGTNDQPIVTDVTYGGEIEGTEAVVMDDGIIYESHDDTDVPDVDDTQEDEVTTYTNFLPEITNIDEDVNDTHEYFIEDESVQIDNDLIEEFDVQILDSATGEFEVSGDFNALAAGETATVSFQYYVEDDSAQILPGETNTSELKTAYVTITGTNDQPIVQDIVLGTGGNNEGIDSVSEELNGLENMYPLIYDTSSWHGLHPSYWEDAGDDMYDGGNRLLINGVEQAIWETSNTSDNNPMSWGDYTFRTNPSSTVLFIEDFEGGTFAIDGNLGSDSSTQRWNGELDLGIPGYRVFYNQSTDSYNSDPSVNQLIITNSVNADFVPRTYANDYDRDGFELQNLDPGSTVKYILFAGNDGYRYDLETFEEIARTAIETDLNAIYESHDDTDVSDVDDTQEDVLTTLTGTLTGIDEDVNDTLVFETENLDVSSEDIDATLITLDGITLSNNTHEDDTPRSADFEITGDFNALAAGETAVVTFQYRAVDDSAFQTPGESEASEWKTVSITVTGTNDQPIIEDVTTVVTEESLLGVEDDLDTDFEDFRYVGSVAEAVSDDDDTDTHTFAIDEGTLTLSVTTANQAFLSFFTLETLQEIEEMVDENTDINEIIDFIVTNEDGNDVADSVTIETAEEFTIPQNIIEALQNYGLLSISMDEETGEYVVESPLFNMLGAHDSITLGFDYRATDHNDNRDPSDLTYDGTDGINESSVSEAKTVTLTIQGTNDQPVAVEADYESLESDLEDVTVGGINTTFSAMLPGADTGSILGDIFTRYMENMDEDLLDLATLTFHLETDTTTYPDAVITTEVVEEEDLDQIDHDLVVVDPNQTVVVVNEDGSFTVSNPTFDQLAVDETATVTFQYYINDESAAVATADNPHEEVRSEPVTVTVTITGTNDQPIIENVYLGDKKTIFESHDNTDVIGVDDTQEDVLTTIKGKLTATDDDVNDEHVFNVRNYTAKDYYGEGNGGPNANGDEGDIRFDEVDFYQKGLNNGSKTIKLMIASDDVDVHNLDVTELIFKNNNAVDSKINFELNGNFNALAAGETATITFEYIANDKRGFGKDGDADNEASISESKLVTITVTGTNDQPIVENVVFNSVPMTYEVMDIATAEAVERDVDFNERRFKVNFSFKLNDADSDGVIIQRGENGDTPLIQVINSELIFTMNTTDGVVQLTYPLVEGDWYDFSYVLKHGVLTLNINGEEDSVSIPVSGILVDDGNSVLIGGSGLDAYIDNIDFRDAVGSLPMLNDQGEEEAIPYTTIITDSDLYSRQIPSDVEAGTQPIFETHDETGDDAIDSDGDGIYTNDEGPTSFTGTLTVTDEDDNDTHTFEFGDFEAATDDDNFVIVEVDGVMIKIEGDAGVDLNVIAQNIESLTLDNNVDHSADFTLIGDLSSLSASEQITVSFKYRAVDNSDDTNDSLGVNEANESEYKVASVVFTGTNDQPVIESLTYDISHEVVGSSYYETSDLDGVDDSVPEDGVTTNEDANNVLLGRLFVSDEDLNDSHDFVLKDMGGSLNNDKPEDVINRYVLSTMASEDREDPALVAQAIQEYNDAFLGKAEITYIKDGMPYVDDDEGRYDEDEGRYEIKVVIFSEDLKGGDNNGNDSDDGGNIPHTGPHNELPITLNSITLTNLIESADDNPNESSVDFALEGDFSALGVGETATVVFRYKAVDDSDNTYDLYDGQNEENESREGFMTLTVTGTNDQPIVTANKVYDAVLEADGDSTVTTDDETTTIRHTFEVQDDDINDTHEFHIESISNMNELETGYELYGPITYIQTDGSLSSTFIQIKLPVGVDADDISIDSIQVIGNEFEIIGQFDALAGALGDNPADILEIKFKYFADDLNGFDETDPLNETSISETEWITVSVEGTNDVPLIEVNPSDNRMVEDSPLIIDIDPETEGVQGFLTTLGSLDITDVDHDQSSFDTESEVFISGTDDINLGGTFEIDADGNWTYKVDNAHPEIQSLKLGEFIEQTYQVTSLDGTASQTITVSIHGTEDVPYLTDDSDLTGDVKEDVDVVNDTLSTTGILYIIDPDDYPNEVAFNTSVTYNAALSDGVQLGTLSLVNQGPTSYPEGTADWTYEVDNTLSRVQTLAEGETIKQVFTVTSIDGSASEDITITVIGTNDAPIAVNDNAGGTFDVTLNTSNWDSSEATLTAYNFDGTVGAPIIHSDGIGVSGGTVDSNQVNEDGTNAEAIEVSYNHDVTSSEIVLSWFNSGMDGNAKWTVFKDGVEVDSGVYIPTSSGDQTISINPTEPYDTIRIEPVVTDGYNDFYVKSVTSTGTTGLATEENTVLDINVLANDYDIDASDVISLVSVDQPVKGSTSIVGNIVKFDPGTDFDYLAEGETATVDFEYTITDGIDTDTATVTVTVTGTNDIPTMTVDTGSVIEDIQVTTTGQVVVVDADDGQSGVLSDAQVGTYGDFSIGADGNWTYTLASSGTRGDMVQALAQDQEVTESFDVTSADGTVTKSVVITVTGTNDQPVVSDVEINGSETIVVTNDTDTNIPDTQTTLSTLTLSGYTGTISDLNVNINLTHTWDSDLDISLIAPDGTRVELTSDNGGAGDDFINTTFDDEATQSIVSGSAPFTGTFRPEGNLSDFDGKDLNGVWTLEIVDDFVIDDGVLNNWSLEFSSQFGPDILEVDGIDTVYSGQLVLTEDLDTNDTHTFQLVAGTVQAVTSSSAMITDLSVNIDSDGEYDVVGNFDQLAEGETATITFQYTATDDSGAANAVSDPKTVTLVVTGTNDTPSVTVDTGTVVEDITLSDSGQVVVVDADDGQSGVLADTQAGTYGDFSVGTDGNWTYILASTGSRFDAVQALAKDEEVQESFNVTSADGTVTKAVVITVIGTNDDPEIVVDQSGLVFDIDENSAYGTSVGDINSTDIDGALPIYTFVDDLGNDISHDKFDINPITGVITVKGDLDYESEDQYIVNVKVIDQNGGEDIEPVTININDLVENIAPDVEDATYNIVENSANGAYVGTVVATDDVDSISDTLSYSFVDAVGNPVTHPKFEIDSSTGEITLRSDLLPTDGLDYEAMGTDKFYMVKVGVDDGIDMTIKDFKINILDLDEPLTGNDVLYISETEPSGVVKGTGSTHPQYFTIDLTGNEGDTVTISFTINDLGNDSVSNITVEGVSQAVTANGSYTFDLTVPADGQIDVTCLGNSGSYKVPNYTVTGTTVSDQVLTLENVDTNDGDHIDMVRLLADTQDFDPDGIPTNSLDEIDMTAGEHILSNINVSDVLAMTETTGGINSLKIEGDTGDEIQLDNSQWDIHPSNGDQYDPTSSLTDTQGNIDQTDKDGNADGYVTYTNIDQTVQLLIAEDIDVKLV